MPMLLTGAVSWELPEFFDGRIGEIVPDFVEPSRRLDDRGPQHLLLFLERPELSGRVYRRTIVVGSGQHRFVIDGIASRRSSTTPYR